MKFWETKKLSEMTDEEWESLCDGCGKCCLIKLQDEDTEEIFYTSVVCDLIDLDTCRCTSYANRCALVPECIDLKKSDIKEYAWLPTTCAYRLLAYGSPLPEWHPLISGNPHSTQDAGVAVNSYAMKESEIGDEDLTAYVIDWVGGFLKE